MSNTSSADNKTLAQTLGIEFVEQSKQRVSARMPIVNKVKQPFGILHGGASVALAETVASYAGWLNVDPKKQNVVGLEINANHLRMKRDGVVTAVATPFHIGHKTQVWDIKITDEQDRLVCISRCTLAVIPLG